MAQITISLPGGQSSTGSAPIVIIGPNGSGKTLQARQIQSNPSAIDFVNALRNTAISPQVPQMSLANARQNLENQRQSARNEPWTMSNEFDLLLRQLLAEDDDVNRTFQRDSESGTLPTYMPTALRKAESLWGEIFPGRSLSWPDGSPTITSEAQAAPYSSSRMSDGERAALYVMGKVLSAQASSVLVVDEPETHFHSLMAVRLWDALEIARADVRFVYVTHDLVFALSRAHAEFFVSSPQTGFTKIDLPGTESSSLRRDILGAASLSYFATRVVFCEGTDASFDNSFWGSWFRGRETVVVPVGGCDAVTDCANAFVDSGIVSNLQPLGLIDRDVRSDAQLHAYPAHLHPLPCHEIEGIVCFPDVLDVIAAHLARTFPSSATASIAATVTPDDISTLAYKRVMNTLRNRAEEAVNEKPPSWTTTDILAHSSAVLTRLGAIPDPAPMVSAEIVRLETIVSEADAQKILELFPSKKILGLVSAEIGQTPDEMFSLVCAALHVTNGGDPLYSLGAALESAFGRLGLPPRSVAPTEQS